ncbi:hypothetical protein B566_EDAN004168 [Ephemera danica]|nr:hypothetical protein B566_EDAN004168 [Ephemera danica]
MCPDEPAQSNKLCPRRNGYFAHPDPGVCNIFYNCIEGDAIEITCPTGLYFDEYAGNCVWPKTALKDGFSCPKEPQIDSTGRAADHPKYSHPEDCQKFYVCLNGVTPREQGCPLGERELVRGSPRSREGKESSKTDRIHQYQSQEEELI